MPHAHTLIRNAVGTALTGLTTTGARVFVNRLHPLADADLPGLRVFTDQDQIATASQHPPHLQTHALQVSVECCAKANTSLDSTVDQMALEVETALANGLTAGGQPVYPVLTAISYQDEPGGTAVGVKRLDFLVGYRVMNTTPDTLMAL
jgi:hypothetical protein